MKTFELKRSEGDKRLFTLMKTGEGYGCMALCDIEDDNLILIGKKDFDKLLTNQKEQLKGDLPLDTKVMVQDRVCKNWVFALYKGKGFAKTDFRNPKDGICATYKHIIPYSLFDPDDPDKWNGTENDYGKEGGRDELHQDCTLCGRTYGHDGDGQTVNGN